MSYGVFSAEIRLNEPTPVDEQRSQDFTIDLFSAQSNNFKFKTSPTVSVLMKKSANGIAIAGGSTKGRTVFTAHTNTARYAVPCFPIVDKDSGYTPASEKSLSRANPDASGGCGVESE